MSRIPSLENFPNNNDFENAVENFLVNQGSEYEAGFSKYLLSYVKTDAVLKSFYLRLIYECEVVKIVLKKRTPLHLQELEMLIEKMESAPSLELIAIYDSDFHQKLFSIAEVESFFTWFRLQSKKLAQFLSGFWKAIGYQTTYYYELMDIHKKIYETIRDQDQEKAIEMMERHFSILLLQLLGSIFQQS